MIKVKEIRTKLGLTQTELAELLGLSAQTRIAEYESGKRNPSPALKVILYMLDKKIISPDMLRKMLDTVHS